MRLRVGLMAAVAGTLLLAACQQAPTSTAASSRPAHSSAPARSSPTPSASPTSTPALALDHVGATASPSGFLALAVISNPSGMTALNVTVEISALDASGGAMTRRSGTIQRIAPESRGAIALPFPVGRTLPSRFDATIKSVQWIADGQPDAAQVTAASFQQDARTPTVVAHVVTQGPSADRVLLTAVCWDGAGAIRGGGSRTVTVPPGVQGHDEAIEVAISTLPARCDVFDVSLH